MFELLNRQLKSGQKEITGEFFQKLIASDSAANDYFGMSVSVSSDGSVIAVGAHCDDDKGSNSGSVYVFTRQANGNYVQSQKLTASDGAADDNFGISTSVSADASVLVVGAHSDDDKGSASGSTYIFKRQANRTYIQTQKLTASDGAAGDQFGILVSISADASVLVVSAYGDDDKGTESGSAYVFAKQANGNYVQTQKLTASDGAASDNFGQSITVSADGSVIVVGAYGDDDKGVDSGSVYIFTKQVSGAYLQTQKLTASDGAAGYYFGVSVSVSSDGSVIVAGAHYGNDKGSASGSVYIFTKQTNGSYNQFQKLTASDGASYDYFGASVSMSADASVIAVGAYGDDDKGTNSGSAYIFTKQADGTYTQKQKLTPPTTAPSALLGYCVSVSDEAVVASARNETIDGKSLAGSVYVFK